MLDYVQLIQPAKSKGYSNNSRSGCYAPLGLISIATYLKNRFPDVSCEVLDGELMSNEEIIHSLRPQSLVGIETKTPNYYSALEIATAAKKIGSHVVAGGVYASAIPERILRNRSQVIDHVVVGYGELPLADILQGRADKLIVNGMPVFNEIPFPDRKSFVNLEEYVLNFQAAHPTWKYRATNIFTHLGCKHQCLFCGRSKPSKGVYWRKPALVWQEIRSLVEDYRIGYLVDFSDTITQDVQALQTLVDCKPRDINPAFHVFSTSEGLTSQNLELLKRLNAKHVFIGAESGDNLLAGSVNKGNNFSPDKTLEAITQLTLAGIKITPSFVLGLPEESEETLERTYSYAQKIKGINNFEEVFCSALIPFPGTPAFSMLENKMLSEGEPFDTDAYDAEELKQLWVNRFCKASYGQISAAVDRILSLGKYTITIKK